MKPSVSAIVSVGIVGTLIAVAWLIFFPAYDTNDDVAIRLFLEGRVVPGAEPSGYAYLVNLALSKVIAWFYTLDPRFSWYDLAEQGTLVMSATLALYCCARSVRFPDQAVIIALLSATMLTAMVAIQFTVIAGLATTVGAGALIFALLAARSKVESLVLSGAGAFLFVLGTLFRLQAALLALFVVVSIALPTIIIRFRQGVLAEQRTIIVFSLLALITSALAWSYYFGEYFGSADWKAFLIFAWRRAQLTDFAAARLSPAVLQRAFVAAGLTVTDYNMLREWLFFDSSIFSAKSLGTVIEQLPTLPNPTNGVAANLSSYVREFPFFVLGIAGIILRAPRFRVALVSALSLAPIIIAVALISIWLKPLPYRAFWPVAVGILFVMWITIEVDQSSLHWIRRVLAALLIASAGFLVLAQAIEKSQETAFLRQLVSSDLARASIGPANLMVIVADAFPFQLVERPFGRPYLQRSVKTLPLGESQTSPPVAQFLKSTALLDNPDRLCSDDNVIVARPSALTALKAFYEERRQQVISYTNVFAGATFSAYHCSVVR
jgi:hypothetical protein